MIRKLSADLACRVDRSAKDWAVSAAVARAMFWIPLLGAITLIPARLFAESFYRGLLTEDGPVEWAGFACFVVAALTAARTARWLTRAGDPIRALAFGIAAVGLGFVAGEEISWGQRILGFSTPADLLPINKQGELTLHNIGPVQHMLNAAALLVGAWCTLMPVLLPASRRGNRFGALLDSFVPPFFLVGSFGVVFAYRLVRYTIWIPSGYTITKYAEWTEFCLAFGACAFMVLTCRNLRRRVGGPLTSQPSSIAYGQDTDSQLGAL